MHVPCEMQKSRTKSLRGGQDYEVSNQSTSYEWQSRLAFWQAFHTLFNSGQRLFRFVQDGPNGSIKPRGNDCAHGA